MMLPPFVRTSLRWTLATIATLCVIFTGLSILATLAAGTLEMDGNYPDGPANLFVSSIAVVRFEGIISANSDTSKYGLTLLWFLNAFGWEWPATTWEKSCGIVHSINGFLPGEPLTLPESLGLTAARLRLPQEDYQCFDKYTGRNGRCFNEFLAAWDEAKPQDATFNTAATLFLYYFAAICVLNVGIQEIAARWFPGMLQCHCPAFIRNRNWCACVKEGEPVTPERRNHLRIVALLLSAGAYAVASLVLAWQGTTLIKYLKDIDAHVGGMNPRMGPGFIGLSVGTLCAILLAALCLKLRAMIRKGRSWMQEQIGEEAIGNEFDTVDDDESDGVIAPGSSESPRDSTSQA